MVTFLTVLLVIIFMSTVNIVGAIGAMLKKNRHQDETKQFNTASQMFISIKLFQSKIFTKRKIY